jgi:hydroxyethylthiazole kinase-like uncharacterized protein yjeF
VTDPIVFDGSTLREHWALPELADDGTKHERGTVVVVGGAGETPGAVLLAGVAALRVGAGRLQICTVQPNASALAVAVPEAAVTALPVTPTGGIGAAAVDLARGAVLEADAVLVVVEAILAAVSNQAVIVLDALALTCGIVNTAQFSHCASRTVITPNASEVEHLLGSAAPGDDADSARVLADRLGVVAVSGSVVAAPGGVCWRTSKGNSGLATSGSGDVLAGAITGLAARGADPLRAALWAVTLHCSAGDRLAHRIGPLGFLAHELLDELPGVLRDI